MFFEPNFVTRMCKKNFYKAKLFVDVRQVGWEN